MKQISKNRKIAGWLFFLFAIGLFCIQMGYFLLRSKYDVEYADNRIFYVINIIDCYLHGSFHIPFAFRN